jgi:hypothetical protein
MKGSLSCWCTALEATGVKLAVTGFQALMSCGAWVCGCLSVHGRGGNRCEAVSFQHWVSVGAWVCGCLSLLLMQQV